MHTIKRAVTAVIAAAGALVVTVAPVQASPWSSGTGAPAVAVVREDLSFVALCSSAASFTNHGRQQAQSRGISEDMMDQAIAQANRTGKRYKRKGEDTIKYVGDKVWVVLKGSCAVVSTGWN
ncbi:hypothetical protein QX204_15785 [Nocardia sp. PE-7]|uniref:hypothetical protein n=1 Tax=Nocardia sp. PE-7 TaxID=3058426 RepID=UPI002658C134|nr:hypothetical protein [Nocardia sp. PE-7]WKG12849.1 hypothetical protein QX204_15785 [Nocardia sp. PE-7]